MEPLAKYIATPARSSNGNSSGSFDNSAVTGLATMKIYTLAQLDTSYHPKVKSAVDAAREWGRRYNEDAQPAPWLILLGPNGVGKTHIARSIWSAFRYTGDPYEGYDLPGDPDPNMRRIDQPMCRFWAAADLIEELAVRTDVGITVKAANLVGHSPVVIIDDVGTEGTLEFIGKEKQEDEIRLRYFRLIDHCYTAGVPGVITTNLTVDRLAALMGPRAWDRLMQMAPARQIVSLEGVPSWRVKAGGR